MRNFDEFLENGMFYEVKILDIYIYLLNLKKNKVYKENRVVQIIFLSTQ